MMLPTLERKGKQLSLVAVGTLVAALACSVMLATSFGATSIEAAETGNSPQLHLDQSTELTGSLRLVIGGSMWQSFTAHWSSSIARIDVYMGTERNDASSCVPASAMLTLVKGNNTQLSSGSANALGQASVTFTCEQTCVAKSSVKLQCAGWQQFTFAAPVAVEEGELYTLGVTAMPDQTTFRPVIGASPPSDNHGGASSLPHTLSFDASLTQYTFRTFMTSASPNVDINNNGDGSNNNGGTTVPDVNSSNSSSVGAAGIVVPIVVVLLLVLLVVFVVVQRRRWAKEKILDSSQLYGINENDYDDDDQQSTGTPRTGRHPIFVQSASNGDQQERPDFEEDSRWADDVSYGMYGGAKTANQTAGTKKRLPLAPSSVDV